MNEYRIGDITQLDGFGGNPISFKHNNITHNNVSHYGLVVDYIPSQTNDIVAYINFVSNSVGNGYILNDQQKMPMHYYLDKWNFVNNSISIFLAHILIHFQKNQHFSIASA